jgi:Flp pilus assembly protein TadG
MNAEHTIGSAGWTRRRGASLVETAIVLPLFLVLVFALLDLGRLFYVQMAMQHALREAGRYAVTGRHQTDPNDPNQSLSRTNSIYNVARVNSFGLPLSGYQIRSAQGGTGTAGGPGDTVTISVTTDLRLMTPLVPMLARFFGLTNFMNNGVYRLTAATSFKNEPFPPSQTN